jgi:hypothetical protein
MKKLLLLDADVVIDLHSFGLFEKVSKAYHINLTKKIFDEAKFYPKGNHLLPIDLKDKVTVIEEINVEYLRTVNEEAREAKLAIDSGEATLIAFMLQSSDEIFFCTCDKAAIKLVSYLNLERKAMSVETLLKDIGHSKRLLPRHREQEFKTGIEEGKTLRIWYKNLI